MHADGKPRLLVVDDEAALLLSYNAILEQSGYEVTTAASSQEAEALLARKRFDLLLCDLTLERQHSGLKVIEQARQLYPKLGCILLTGYPDPELSKQVQAAGIHTVFNPVAVPQLLETLDFVLRRQRQDEKTEEP